jgi:fatty-acid desaturase
MFIIFPLMHLFVLYGIYTSDYWVILTVGGILLFYPLISIGQSIGLHKMFAHKAFKPKKWFPYLSAVVGTVSFFGDPLNSAVVHRIHHKNADAARDPHSPKDGIFHAYLGWIYNYAPSDKEVYVGLDLIREYPWLTTYSKYDWAVFLTFHATMYAISPELFFMFMLGCLLAVNNGMLLNAFSHRKSSDGWLAIDAGKWDYSNGVVKDYNAWFIKNWFAENPNDVKHGNSKNTTEHTA